MFEILHENCWKKLFVFSFSGVIRNTVVLNYSISHSYILSVVAFDCGMRRSEPLLVTVEVRQACNTGWTGEFQKAWAFKKFAHNEKTSSLGCSRQLLKKISTVPYYQYYKKDMNSSCTIVILIKKSWFSLHFLLEI